MEGGVQVFETEKMGVRLHVKLVENFKRFDNQLCFMHNQLSWKN